MPELPRPLPPPTWRDRVTILASWRDGVPLPALLVVIGIAVAITIGVAVTSMRSASRPDVALSLPRADAPTGSAALVSPSTTIGGPLHVHAAGAVTKPGVVQVPPGARVVDVVAAAGGAAPDADLNQINLAELVSDGARVYIPRVGEVVAALGAPTASAKSGGSADANGIVNLNEASQSELESLPGVGPATAKAIVDYRTQNGRFRSVEDLLNVRGIGPAKLEQIKPYARV